MDKKYHVQALHGFLGMPQDWKDFKIKDEHFFAFNLFRNFPLQPFEVWAREYNQYVKKKSDHENIFLGYSLGGRLGLHAVLENPKNWKAAIFISTHPGLSSDKEKQSRVLTDETWAKRFESEPWEPLISAWNNQGVFENDSFTFKRDESDYKRATLSQSLKIWSLGKQDDFTKNLNSLQIPILWMVGANDTKLSNKAKELKFKNTKSKLCVVADAGHRLPWQQPEKFLSIITKFIESLE